MRTLNNTAVSDPKRGGAMVITLVTVSVLAIMAGAALTVNTANKNEIEASRSRMRSIYLAEAGIAEALGTLYASGINGDEPPDSFGSKDDPRESQAGRYWSELIRNGDGTYTAHATGTINGSSRALEVIVELEEETVYDHAIFAGNSGGDKNYKLKFGGYGIEADELYGDIYSGGDVLVAGNAEINGQIRAAGKVNGKNGESGVSLPIPDIKGMDYAANNDVDVAALFASADARWRSDDAGGSAWQLPEDNPAHIFRKNPSDRSTVLSRNGKDDYFLEDPYETVRWDRDYDGSDAYEVTLTGVNDNPGEDSSNAVFFIDGNLWIHNLKTYSMKFTHNDGESVNCTFVVRGNIYFSDNVFYDDQDTDGIAFIAMKEDGVDDTGNIYFGDPVGGTLEYMDGYMYAENDFVDMNLSATGSKTVTVNGNMTAGNQVRIERDYRNSHSKLTVKFDDRVRNGTIELPSLPTNDMGEPQARAYSVVSWREVPVDHWVNRGRVEVDDGDDDDDDDILDRVDDVVDQIDDSGGSSSGGHGRWGK